MPKTPKPKNPPPLERGQIYHIYNRGVNRENIFVEKRNYSYFLQLYTQHILPIADTFAYCMLKNHFHILVRIKDKPTLPNLTGPGDLSGLEAKPPSQYFSNFFNAYARSINLAYGRTGSLFQRPFGRIPVTSDAYFMNLVVYIHQNPQIHGFVDDFRSWPYSSYEAILSTSSATKLKRDEVFSVFGGMQALTGEHAAQIEVKKIAHLIGDDD